MYIIHQKRKQILYAAIHKQPSPSSHPAILDTVTSKLLKQTRGRKGYESNIKHGKHIFHYMTREKKEMIPPNITNLTIKYRLIQKLSKVA